MTILLGLMALVTMGQDAGAAAPAKEKKICKTIRLTGSRLATRRECHTESELRRQNSADELERQRDMQARDAISRGT